MDIMTQHFSAMLAVLLIALAGVTILVMLEMNSTTTQRNDGQKKNGWRLAHRILGYLFLLFFAFILVCMVIRAGGFQQENQGNPMLYVIISLLLIPLFLVKAVIARRQAQTSTKLLLVGLATLVLSFGLVGVAYIVLINGPAEQGDERMEFPKNGQAIMNRKCSKCHSLERVYQTYQNGLGWSETVKKMAEFDYPNITGTEARQIIKYLTWQQEKRQMTEAGRNLVAKKCGVCHELARVFGAEKSSEEWVGTVDKMTEIMRDQNFLTVQEKKDIISFLSRRKNKVETVGKEEMGAASALVAAKCGAGCHDLNRILAVKKNRPEWMATINSMVEITGNSNYLTEQEKKDIINFLSSRKRSDGKEDKLARPKSSSADHPLISRKCGTCHDLERVHQIGKNEDEWEETVSSMAERTGDPNYLSEQEKKEIVSIISTWESQK